MNVNNKKMAAKDAVIRNNLKKEFKMSKIDQEEAFGRKKGDWVWCLHCGTAYQVGEFRAEKPSEELFKLGVTEDLQMCPYPDCDGNTVLDSWPWEAIKEKHPDYPEVPERRKVYALYPRSYWSFYGWDPHGLTHGGRGPRKRTMEVIGYGRR